MEDITDYLEDLPDIKMYEPAPAGNPAKGSIAGVMQAGQPPRGHEADALVISCTDLNAASDGRFHKKQKHPTGLSISSTSLLP
jgi:hypothetical protein